MMEKSSEILDEDLTNGNRLNCKGKRAATFCQQIADCEKLKNWMVKKTRMAFWEQENSDDIIWTSRIHD